MSEERLCAICGKPEEDHHQFMLFKMPEGCICDSKDWESVNEILPVCAEYVGDGTEWCEDCGHDEKCHKK